MNIQREAINELLKWKNNPYRKPLVLQGARQVGKSWMLRYFAINYFENYVEINFEREPEIKDFFAKTKDVKRIIQYLQITKSVAIEPTKTLIFFDEIQECNDALNSLKYFQEDASEYFVVCAGSLLGVALKRQGSSFPVGKVDFLTIYPVSFKEYIKAAEPTLSSQLESITAIEEIPELLHSELTDKYRSYHICGGMPEAVSRFIDTGDTKAIDYIINSINTAYTADFSKHIDSSDIPRVRLVWNNLQQQLAKENKKFKFALIEKNARARDYEAAIEWLHLAGLVHKIYATETIKLPINAYRDDSAFKLYLNDVGVLRVLFRLHPSIVTDGDLLFKEFKGILTENFVLLSLIRQFGYEPVYWKSGNQAEIEFVIDFENKIIPIEAKSSESVRSRSLSEYRKKNQPEIAIRYSMKNLRLDDGLLNIPLYMADYTEKLLKIVLQ
jgi:hypothetical protein